MLLAAEGSLGSAGDLASTDFLALIRILGSLATTQGLGWHSIQRIHIFLSVDANDLQGYSYIGCYANGFYQHFL